MQDTSNIKPKQLNQKQIVIFGFGSQGVSQALNLRDSGFEVKIALKGGSSSLKFAIDEGFETTSFEEGAKIADVIMLLTPDETHGEIFSRYILPNFKAGGSIIVAHGFSFHFGFVKNFENFNIGMIAPKAVGKAVRSNFISGAGIFSLIAKFNQVNEDLEGILLEIAAGIGSKKVLSTTFKIECESDLFGEQAVLCGSIPSILKNAFDVLIEAGFPPLIAYYECVHELKLIADLIYEKGINSMFSAISNTAKFGGLTTGDFIVDENVKDKMREVLAKIQSGEFAGNFMKEALENDYQFKKEIADKFQFSGIETAGKDVINLLILK
jgi:ketol-acid reductoisomerase